MQTMEVPTDQWAPFLDEFSRRHQGELVTVELLGEDLGALPEARAVPLVGVTLEERGSPKQQIDIVVGPEPRSHLMHAVRLPRRLRLARTNEGEDVALQIESGDGPMMLLRLGESERTLRAP